MKIITESTINRNDLKYINDSEVMDELYKRGVVGKLTVWTDGSYLSQTRMNQADLFKTRDVVFEINENVGVGEAIPRKIYFGTFGGDTKYSVYLPSGKVILKTNTDTSYATSIGVELKGGMETAFYWRTPESRLIVNAYGNRNFSKEAERTLYGASELSKISKDRKNEAERVAKYGDGSTEDGLCQKYGFKVRTSGYAECRLRLDLAKAESIKQQQQYERELAAYEQQMASIQREREQQRAMKQLELGLRMMGGQSPVDAVNSVGTGAPIVPRAPTPINQTITLPNGRMVNCTTMGTMTNCF